MPQEDVAGIQATRNAVEPATLREVANRYLSCAECLNSLRRKLNVSEKVYLRDFPKPDFLFQVVTVADLNNIARLAYPHSLRVEIERPQVLTRRNQLPNGCGGRALIFTKHL